MRVIAEAGCNWSTMDEAKKFIDESKRLGLWATKFQIYVDELIKDNPDREFLKSIMIDKERAKELYQYGRSIQQEVFFTPMFCESVDWLEEIGINYYKIRHKDQDNHILKWKIFETNKKCIISTDYHQNYYYNFIELKCIPKYPALIEDYIYHKGSGHYQGVSDHTSDLEMLRFLYRFDYDWYFEKHVKLDGTTPLEDEWSVSFSELEAVLK